MAARDRLSNGSDEKEPEPFYVTQEGLDRLHERLAYLKRILPERAEEARRTAAHGDRSENDAYKAAKGSLRRAKAARPCPLRAAVQRQISRRAAPAGWLEGRVE